MTKMRMLRHARRAARPVVRHTPMADASLAGRSDADAGWLSGATTPPVGPDAYGTAPEPAASSRARPGSGLESRRGGY